MDLRVIRVETGEVIQLYTDVEGGIISGTFIGTPAPGTATYAIQVLADPSDGSGGALEGAFNISLVAQGFKR